MGSKASGIAPSKLASLQEDDRSSNKDEKEGSDSGGSGGGSDERDDGPCHHSSDLAVREWDHDADVHRPLKAQRQSRRYIQVFCLVKDVR